MSFLRKIASDLRLSFSSRYFRASLRTPVFERNPNHRAFRQGTASAVPKKQCRQSPSACAPSAQAFLNSKHHA